MKCNSNAWKLFGAVVAVAAAALMVSMYPDLKRYIKIESM